MTRPHHRFGERPPARWSFAPCMPGTARWASELIGLARSTLTAGGRGLLRVAGQGAATATAHSHRRVPRGAGAAGVADDGGESGAAPLRCRLAGCAVGGAAHDGQTQPAHRPQNPSHQHAAQMEAVSRRNLTYRNCIWVGAILGHPPPDARVAVCPPAIHRHSRLSPADIDQCRPYSCI